MPKVRKLILWTLGGLVILFVAAAVGLRFAAAHYLRSEAFRKRVSQATASTLGLESGEYQPFQLDGSNSLATGGFLGGASSAGLRVAAEQIRADLAWRGLWHRKFDVPDVSIQRLQVELGPRKGAPAGLEVETPRGVEANSSSSFKLELGTIQIARADLSWQGNETSRGRATGSTVKLKPDGQDWRAEIQGGEVMQEGWPALRLERARLRQTRGVLSVDEAILRNGDASLTLHGEINGPEGTVLTTTASNWDVQPLLPKDWRAKLSGRLAGEFRLHKTGNSPLHWSGPARLDGARLTALPILDGIALFTRSQRFREIAITTATFRIDGDEKEWRMTEVVLESAGLLRLEGSCNSRAGELTGDFQVGLSAATLQWLPVGQGQVFTPGHNGYLWAPMHVSGPLDHPTEDLSARLAAAAAGEIMTQGASLIESAGSLLQRLLR